MSTANVKAHRWTRRDYERLAAKGFFPPGKRVELVDGVIYDKPPLSSFHATALQIIQEALRVAYPTEAGYEIRSRFPLVLGEDSEPEPDLAVVAGSFRDYAEAHPTTALLIVEIADSSLLHDRKRKIPLYARCAISESWLFNLAHRTLEVYRDLVNGIYQTRLVLREGDAISPIARPEASLSVSDLFP